MAYGGKTVYGQDDMSGVLGHGGANGWIWCVAFGVWFEPCTQYERRVDGFIATRRCLPKRLHVQCTRP
jgi:hypothetical protein